MGRLPLSGGKTALLVLRLATLFLHAKCAPASSSPINTTSEPLHEHESSKGIEVVEIHWEYVHLPLIIALSLIVATVIKSLIQESYYLSCLLANSASLIVAGLLLGLLLKKIGIDEETFAMDKKIFFLFLLPPIIFDAGYFLPNRAFFQNIGAILMFAVFGTILNAVVIGSGLYFLSKYHSFSIGFSALEVTMFAALVSAVDPVAVIAVFEELHVNDFIFVNVFGEALINDGVTVVLYKLMESFLSIGSENITALECATGGVSFFVVTIGGICIGILFAILTSLLTKFTVRQRTLSPLFVFVIPYICYLTAEMISLSAIIALAVCAMTMKQYIKGNISGTAANSVKYFIKMIAQSAETIIFLFLGLSAFDNAQHFDAWFIAFTICFCLLARVTGVLLQCAILNRCRAKKFSRIDQFVLSYGGLRGAIAYGLAVSLPDSIQAKPMFVTATIVLIYFTVFVQGSTIRPLVKLLNVERRDDREVTMSESVFIKYIHYTMSGLEDISGQKGHYSLLDTFERFNSLFIAPLLMHNKPPTPFDASTIVRAFAKISLSEAVTLTETKPSMKRKKSTSGVLSSDPPTITATQNRKCSELNPVALRAMLNELIEQKINNLRTELRMDASKADEDIPDDNLGYNKKLILPKEK